MPGWRPVTRQQRDLGKVRNGGRVRDGGMVSAELAAAVPAVLLVLVVGVTAVRLGVDEIRCVDAARLAARALARGDSEGAAVAMAVRAAPAESAVSVRGSGTEVVVEVAAGRDLAGWGRFTAHGVATATRETAGSRG